MKKLLYSFLPVLLIAALVACEDDKKLGMDEAEYGVNFRMIAKAEQLNLNDASPMLELTMYSENTNIEEVNVMIERTDASSEETTQRFLLKKLDRGSITNDGNTKLSFTLAQLAAAVNVDESELEGGDSFTLYNLVTLDNGITYPDTVTLTDASGTKKVLNLGNVFTAGGTPSYTALLQVNLVCPSDLAGTYSYVTTNIECENCDASVPGAGACGVSVSGTGELEETDGFGVYAVSDATFGQYGCAWDDSPAEGVTLSDVCGKLSTGGADAYGLVYTFTIVSNDGETLTIDWENDYGDSGRTALTRTDGKTWPDNLRN
jgi:hypothetical protein